MCLGPQPKLSTKAVLLVKDCTMEHTHGAVEFYFNMNDQWSYSKLIEYPRMSFESRETFHPLLSDFYARFQKPKATEEQFADELQVLARNVISVFPEWRSQLNKALKTQFAHRLWDQYFAAMAHNLLKAAPPDTTIPNFQAECIPIFWTRSRKAMKMLCPSIQLTIIQVKLTSQ